MPSPRLLLPALSCLAVLAGPLQQPVRHGALHRLFAEAWDAELRWEPAIATQTGAGRYNDRLGDRSDAAFDRRLQELDQFHRRAKAIRPDLLSEEDQLSRTLFLHWLEESKVLAMGPINRLLALSHRGGPLLYALFLPSLAPLQSEKEARDYLLRLKGLPAALDQARQHMTEGMAKGVTWPRPVVLRTLELLDSLDEASLRKPLVAHLSTLPASIPVPLRQSLEIEAKGILEGTLEPALRELTAFMRDRYLPGCRTTLGVSELPNGRAWYQQRIRIYTTTNETPEAIHQFGLEELKRLRTEMTGALHASGFKGDLQAFGRHLDQDPSFRFASAEALLTASRAFAKRVDGALPKIMRHLPRTPYGIEPMPSAVAKTSGRGHSRPGNLQTGMAGFVFINTHKLNAHRTWGLQPFLLHEAAPGHQTELSLAQEREEAPTFRQQLSISAFSEGWALYCEGLGEDLGFASDATDRFGQARAEAFRAARLVVDTGLHTQGWSRERAVTFLVQEAFLTQDHAETEVDRYLALPGQALSYQMGLGTFRRLRKEAEAALGSRFDLRAFHDALLEAGPLPMHILDARVRSRLRLPAK